jgi:hypothetical protein
MKCVAGVGEGYCDALAIRVQQSQGSSPKH